MLPLVFSGVYIIMYTSCAKVFGNGASPTYDSEVKLYNASLSFVSKNYRTGGLLIINNNGDLNTDNRLMARKGRHVLSSQRHANCQSQLLIQPWVKCTAKAVE